MPRSEARPRSVMFLVARLVAVAILFLAFSPAGCSSHAQRTIQANQRWNHVRGRVKFQLATQQYEGGRVADAIETVNDAIAIDPASADQFLLLAHCYLEQGKFVSAGEAAEQAKLCDARNAEIDYTLGVIAERTERLDAALAHYRRARDLDAGVPEYVVAEAECLTTMGHTDDALALVTANTARFDSDGTMETLLAQIYLLAGHRDRALDNLALALERSGCSPGSATDGERCAMLVEDLGRMLTEAGRHAQAVALLRPHVDAHRDAPPSVVNALCSSYLATARYEKAASLLRDQVSAHPDGATSWVLLARAATMMEDWTIARRSADRFAQLRPEDGAAHLLRGFVCWKQADLTAADDSLRRALAIDSEDPLAHLVLGWVLEDSGRDRSIVEAHYNKAVQIDPRFARTSGPPELISAARIDDSGEPARQPNRRRPYRNRERSR